MNSETKDEKHIIRAMKRYSVVQPLYSINEFLDYKNEVNTDDCCNMKQIINTMFYLYMVFACLLLLSYDS